MTNTADRLIERLLEAGISEELARASLPDWWSPEEFQSTSARSLVSLLLARRLSLDPASLLDDGVPVGFLHSGPIKFKHMRLRAGERRDALVAFARGVARITLSALPSASAINVPSQPLELRQAVLDSGRPQVSFGDVLTLCWSLGIPVLHLRLFPGRTKGVSAIAVRLGQRHAILVARESGFEAQYMFHVAHELGHIALGHLKNASVIVDADPDDPANDPEEMVYDDEEAAADAYAQAILTGSPNFEVVRNALGRGGSLGTAKELAAIADQASAQMGIDAGHFVMCFGHSSGDWALTAAAAKLLPRQQQKPGTLVNKVLWQQLNINDADESATSFLKAVAPV